MSDVAAPTATGLEKGVPERKIFETADMGKAATAKSQPQRVADGFRNFAAKLGVTAPGSCPSADNLLTEGGYSFNLVTRNRVLLEAAYRGSWIVGKMIDIFAEDMTRAGLDISTDKGVDKLTKLNAAMSRLKIWKSICSTIKWGKLYGGACGVVQIEGQNPDTPLDLDTVSKGQFKGIVVYDRWQLWPVLDQLIESGPDMGLPKFYDIVLGSNLNDPGMDPGGKQTTNATGRVRVHHSRCIRIIGIELPFFQAITEQMWGESVLERIWDRLIMFDDATTSTGNLINRAQLRTVKVDGLREILAAGGKAEEALISQFEYMRKFQSNEGITLMDKNDEFDSVAYTFSGLADVLTQFGQQVSGGIDIPLVRLFGQSPAGLSATGESDLRLYYDGVNAQQEAQLRNYIEMILKILWRSLFNEELPDDLTFTFKALWQMTATDKATVAKTIADTVVAAHQEGLVSAATAMQELKHASGDIGLFSHITDEDIEEAKTEEPPQPEEQGNEIPGEAVGEPGEGPAAPKKPTGDSAFKRIKRWLAGA